VIKLSREGYLAPGSRVVCILTGHGLKDPDTALQACRIEPAVVAAEEAAVLGLLEKIDVL